MSATLVTEEHTAGVGGNILQVSSSSVLGKMLIQFLLHTVLENKPNMNKRMTVYYHFENSGLYYTLNSLLLQFIIYIVDHLEQFIIFQRNKKVEVHCVQCTCEVSSTTALYIYSKDKYYNQPQWDSWLVADIRSTLANSSATFSRRPGSPYLIIQSVLLAPLLSPSPLPPLHLLFLLLLTYHVSSVKDFSKKLHQVVIT